MKFVKLEDFDNVLGDIFECLGCDRTNVVKILNKYDIEEWVFSEDVNDFVEGAHRVHCHSTGGETHWIACSICMNPIDFADKYCRSCGAKLIETEEGTII